MTPEEILLNDIAKGVKLRLPTAVHRYLAMRTEFDIRGWETCPAMFEDKWRLAMRLMHGSATDEYVISVFAGGILYPRYGGDPVYCPECLEEMVKVDETWFCRDWGKVVKR